MIPANVRADVERERDEQDKRWGVQDHNTFVWLAVLGEEYGEACRAALSMPSRRDTLNLRRELVQCAAVAIAAIESIDRVACSPEEDHGNE